jgi:hypothetical protein
VKLLFILPLVVVALVSTAAAEFESPDLKAGKVHVNRVVLTPVRASVVQLDWKAGPLDQDTPMEAESRQAEKDLLPVVSTALRNVGFTINDTTFSSDALGSNKDLNDKVKLVPTALELMNFQIEVKPKDYAKQTVSLGNLVNDLHAPDDSDAIVIVQVHAALETKGKKLSNFVSPGLNSAGGWDMADRDHRRKDGSDCVHR